MHKEDPYHFQLMSRLHQEPNLIFQGNLADPMPLMQIISSLESHGRLQLTMEALKLLATMWKDAISWEEDGFAYPQKL